MSSRADGFSSTTILHHAYLTGSVSYRRFERYFSPVLHEEGGMRIKIHVHGQIGIGKTTLCRRLEKGKSILYRTNVAVAAESL